MIESLGIMFLLGLLFGKLFDLLKLPKLLGMLLIGILLGPSVLNVLHPSLLSISADLRQMALIVILLKAGLSLNIHDLKKVGRPAVLMSFVPATFEIVGIVLLAPLLIGFSWQEAAVLGSVLAAVSPAVVVPKMLELMENGYGAHKGIPQMVLAGASIDDIYVIVLFSVFTSLTQGNTVSASSFLQIPVSIILGLLLGCALGFVLNFLFHRIHMRDSAKVVMMLGLSFLLVTLENAVKPWVSFSALLSVMSCAMVLSIRYKPLGARLSAKFSKLWVAAEILLFVLVGAAVDIQYVSQAGLSMVLLILGALCFRALGVLTCLIKTKLIWKERLFCIISYLPKATVQAAIGSVPLSMGLACGQTVLSAAVLAILISAPLGAMGIDWFSKKLLSKS